MKKRLRIEVVPTKRTDLTCIYCGRFRAEFAIVGVLPEGEPPFPITENSAQAGLHRKCARVNRPRRPSRKRQDHAKGVCDKATCEFCKAYETEQAAARAEDPGNNPIRSGPEE
jgi:hypothetical protein